MSSTERRRTRVVVVSARVGAGHDGAARELGRRFRERGWSVDQVDVLDLVPARAGQLLCDLYRRQLERAPRSWGWALGALDGPPLAAAARRLSGLAAPLLDQVLGVDTSLAVSTYRSPPTRSPRSPPVGRGPCRSWST